MKKRWQYWMFAPQDSLAKIWFAVPIIAWTMGGTGYFMLQNTASLVRIGQQLKAVSTVGNLQEDINFISTKAEASKLFELSKKDMINNSRRENFLMKRAKKELDRSVFSRSVGSMDEQKLLVDTALNISEDTSLFLSPDSVQAQQNLDYVMANMKVQKQHGQTLLEQERQAKLEAARTANRQRNVDLQQSTLKVEAEAYKKGLVDQQERYEAFYGATADAGIDPSLLPPDAVKSQPTKKSKLSFATSTGVRDDLKNNSVKKVPKATTPSAAKSAKKAAPQGFLYAPLQAIIDQSQKVKSGEKVELRTLEAGDYKGFSIPKNTILYGICTVNDNRMALRISSISLAGQLIPSDLEVYDLDGMPGIYIDGTFDDISRQAIDQGLNAANNLGVSLPFVGDFSVNLGRQANRSKSAHLPAGYAVLLYDKSLK